MLVVLTIMTVLSLVVLSGQSTFNKTLILNDTAYSVAYSLREAQAIGLSSRKQSGGLNNVSYGVYFDRAVLGQYLLFTDSNNSWKGSTSTWCPLGTVGRPDAKPGDCVYRPGGYDSVLKTTNFTKGFNVQKFCARPGSASKRCSDDLSSNGIDTLHVTFVRPNMTPVISIHQPSGNKFYQTNCAEIYIQAPEGGGSRIVRVSQYGEISVNQTCP
mgnify:CR=1 FL=1